MGKISIIYGSIMVLIMGHFLMPSSVHAEKNLSDIQKERKEIKEKLTDQEKKLADILIEVEQLDQEIYDLEITLQSNQKEIQKAEKDISKVEKEIKKIEEKIEARFDILKDRAKSYQENGGDIGYLDVLFQANSFHEFISRASIVSQITDSDADLIEEQAKDKKKVEKKLADLEDLKAELKLIEKNIGEQKESKNKKKKHLKKKQDKITAMADELEMKEDELTNLQSELKLNQVQQELPDNAKTPNKTNGSGTFIWPTDGGYVSSPMGKRWGKMHKGIDIARTDRSTSPPIYAAESGTVEIAGFNDGGYGNRVIINHGNGVKTLYGHMSKIAVSSGQKVEKGQQIGVMGNTGASKGIHLHFEVHVNGNIQNPLGYL